MRFVLFVIMALSLGCAKQSGLTGGEKDVTPPEPMEFDPPNLSTNFDGNSFEIEFDEYFQVKALTEQLIISPLLDEPPQYALKGKTLIINWEEELLANTTYQFNFGAAIADLNESNVNTDLLYVFSTGSFIDSLSVSGKVLSAMDNEPLPGASVMLYRGDSDTLPRTVPPDFFALTDEQGVFKLRYLPEGEFKIFALAEESSNYKYDGPPEKIGFLQERVLSGQSDSTAAQIIIPAFTERDTSQFILSTEKRDYGYYKVVFNLPSDRPLITFTEAETDVVIPSLNLLNETRDTLTCRLPLQLREEPVEEITVVVNDGEAIRDTSFWYPETDPKFRQETKLKITSNLQNKRLDRSDDIKINLNNPLEEIDTTLISIYEDSVAVVPEIFKKSTSGLQVSIRLDIKEESAYQVIMNAGAIKDFYGLYSDSLAFDFKLEDEEYYGNLTIGINDSLINDLPNPIYEFTNEQRKVIRSESLASKKQLRFDQLTPGKYGVRIFFDANQNGEWDTGNYDLGVQPELRLIYSETMEVRSNWDMEIDWTPAPIPYGLISN